MLGGSALAAPLALWGCAPDDLAGPEATQDPDEARRQAADLLSLSDQSAPALLFVPGFTGTLFGNKSTYFADQKAGLPNREIIDMNERDGFDSDDGAVQCNADAIGRVLADLKAQGKRATIVSHSKGGQDVLHALIEVDNEANLPYRDPRCPSTRRASAGSPIRQHLWSAVSGWVAFTSNFFEGEFPIPGCKVSGPGLPPTALPPRGFCLSPDDAPSAYTGYAVRCFRERAVRQRQQYMRDHRATIAHLVQCITILSAYATYIPRRPLPFLPFPLSGNPGPLNLFNFGIRVESALLFLDGANDGLVPARAARLPGARFTVKLPDDPSTFRCGVDHLAPAQRSLRRFWTPSFRITQTHNYIQTVESVPGDTVPPEIHLDVHPTTLWPPNHEMQLVATGVTAVDLCDPNPTVVVTVASNEPVNGRGDGNTDPDWRVERAEDGTFDVWVRAERSGRGTGRVYTITVRATDAWGNTATESATVSVPHDRGVGAASEAGSGRSKTLAGPRPPTTRPALS